LHSSGGRGTGRWRSKDRRYWACSRSPRAARGPSVCVRPSRRRPASPSPGWGGCSDHLVLAVAKILFLVLASVHPYRVGVQSEPGCSSPFYLPTYAPVSTCVEPVCCERELFSLFFSRRLQVTYHSESLAQTRSNGEVCRPRLRILPFLFCSTKQGFLLLYLSPDSPSQVPLLLRYSDSLPRLSHLGPAFSTWMEQALGVQSLTAHPGPGS